MTKATPATPHTPGPYAQSAAPTGEPLFRQSFRNWLIDGGAGHEDGEDGIRAGMISMSAAIEMVDQYIEDCARGVKESAAPPAQSEVHNEARILAALMGSLIDQKCPENVSGYAIMDAIRPFLPAPPANAQERTGERRTRCTVRRIYVR